MFRKYYKIILIVAILSITLLSGSIVFAEEKEKSPTQYEAPKLEMPIPGVPQLSNIQVEGGMISVPWIAQYLAGVYKYAIGLAVSLTIFMIMIGGFLWITAAGNPGKIGKAKNMIIDAIVGLILAVGSYLILYTINPDLVEFKSIQIGVIKPEKWDKQLEIELSTTEVNTGSAGEVISSSSFTAPTANCKINFTESQPDTKPMQVSPRSLEFIRKVSSIITTQTVPEKIREIAMAARDCAISLGSCGKTTSVVQTIAILGSEAGEKCYKGKGVRGIDCVTADQIKGLSTSLSKWVNSINCCLYCCGGKCLNEKAIQNGCKQTPCTQNCLNSKEEAKKIVSNKLRAEISDWSDWINLLKPGDEIVVYNANDSYSGGHSVTFLGWKNFNNKIAIVLSGNWGKPVKIDETNLKDAIIRRITRAKY